MQKTSSPVKDALDGFYTKFFKLVDEKGTPLVPYDSEWLSVCYLEDGKEGDDVRWLPKRQTQAIDMFDRLSEALETPIHPDLIDFYSHYWSDPITARTAQGKLSLLQVWNNDDFERLRANFIGHALQKKRRRHPLTLFFALTLPDTEMMISIDNADGRIWVERPGKSPHLCIADSLAEFINSLEPELTTV